LHHDGRHESVEAKREHRIAPRRGRDGHADLGRPRTERIQRGAGDGDQRSPRRPARVRRHERREPSGPRGLLDPGGLAARGADPARTATAEPGRPLNPVTEKDKTDFCYHMGGVETGMPIVKRQLGLAGLDVRAPTTDAIRTLIERLAVVEQDFKSPEETLSNRERRLDWLVGTDS